MKQLNKFAYGKTAFLLIFTIIIFFNPSYYPAENLLVLLSVTLGAMIAWTIFGALITYVIVKFFNGRISVPKWNDNPFNLREPLGTLLFIGIGAIVIGISDLLSVVINHSDLGVFGLQNLFTGIGILISIGISTKFLIKNRTT